MDKPGHPAPLDEVLQVTEQNKQYLRSKGRTLVRDAFGELIEVPIACDPVVIVHDAPPILPMQRPPREFRGV